MLNRVKTKEELMHDDFIDYSRKVGITDEKMKRVATAVKLLPPLSKDTWFTPSTDNSTISSEESDLKPDTPLDLPSFTIELSNGAKLNRHNICRILIGCDYQEPDSKKEDAKIIRPGLKLPTLSIQTSEEDANQAKPGTQLPPTITLNKVLPIIKRPKKRTIIRVDSNYQLPMATKLNNSSEAN